MDTNWKKHEVIHDLTWYEKLWTIAYTLTAPSGKATIWRAYEECFVFTDQDPMAINASIGKKISEEDCQHWRLILRSESRTEEVLGEKVEPLIEYAQSTFCSS